MARIEAPAAEEMTAEQAELAARIAKVIGGVHGPYAAWMHRPAVAEAMFGVLHALRDLSELPRRVRMVATLATIRHWGAEYAWEVNKGLALDAGLAPEAVDAIERGETPDLTDKAEALAHEIATELLAERRLSDTTFAAAEAELGPDLLVELISVVGYFSAVALTVVAYDLKPHST